MRHPQAGLQQSLRALPAFPAVYSTSPESHVPGESIQKVEAVLKAANLEAIGKTNEKVLMGPIYLGSCGIDKWGSQSLLFIAGCLEQNIYDVERFMYREVTVIFENNGIKIGACEAREE